MLMFDVDVDINIDVNINTSVYTNTRTDIIIHISMQLGIVGIHIWPPDCSRGSTGLQL